MKVSDRIISSSARIDFLRPTLNYYLELQRGAGANLPAF
jgi:hypothetical protein